MEEISGLKINEVKGARFVFTLPMGNKMNAIDKYVLIVEDDAQIRSFITYLVKNEGFSYITAENAQDALSILVSKPIDLMLLDWDYLITIGMELIKKVREWSQMPIIYSYPQEIRKPRKPKLWIMGLMIT